MFRLTLYVPLAVCLLVRLCDDLIVLCDYLIVCVQPKHVSATGSEQGDDVTVDAEVPLP